MTLDPSEGYTTDGPDANGGKAEIRLAQIPIAHVGDTVNISFNIRHLQTVEA